MEYDKNKIRIEEIKFRVEQLGRDKKMPYLVEIIDQ